VGSKGIYGSHYFESSLGLTAFVHSRAPDPARSYLIYVNRSRTDALRGLFGGWKRSLIGGRLRDGARKSMEAIKVKLESEYGKLARGPAASVPAPGCSIVHIHVAQCSP
jgi:hypothetical protein